MQGSPQARQRKAYGTRMHVAVLAQDTQLTQALKVGRGGLYVGLEKAHFCNSYICMCKGHPMLNEHRLDKVRSSNYQNPRLAG